MRVLQIIYHNPEIFLLKPQRLANSRAERIKLIALCALAWGGLLIIPAAIGIRHIVKHFQKNAPESQASSCETVLPSPSTDELHDVESSEQLETIPCTPPPQEPQEEPSLGTDISPPSLPPNNLEKQPVYEEEASEFEQSGIEQYSVMDPVPIVNSSEPPPPPQNCSANCLTESTIPNNEHLSTKLSQTLPSRPEHPKKYPLELLAAAKNLTKAEKATMLKDITIGKFRKKIQNTVVTEFFSNPANYVAIIEQALEKQTITPEFLQDLLHHLNPSREPPREPEWNLRTPEPWKKWLPEYRQQERRTTQPMQMLHESHSNSAIPHSPRPAPLEESQAAILPQIPTINPTKAKDEITLPEPEKHNHLSTENLLPATPAITNFPEAPPQPPRAIPTTLGDLTKQLDILAQQNITFRHPKKAPPRSHWPF